MTDLHTLQWEALSAGYGKRVVLHGVSLCARAGELTVIVGPNGCGKSTLLRAALGILPPFAGEVRIGGDPVSSLHRQKLARRVAYLSQGRDLPDMTVSQLVLHGRFPHVGYPRRYTAADRQIARESMERLGLGGLADAPLSTLSGGMRQTAYIAMALAQQTEYILLDEPTTYLDVAHALSLMALLRRLAEERHGIVAVLHDLPLAFRFAHRVAVMHEGRLVMADTPEAVATSGCLEKTMGVSLYRPVGEELYLCRESSSLSNKNKE